MNNIRTCKQAFALFNRCPSHSPMQESMPHARICVQRKKVIYVCGIVNHVLLFVERSDHTQSTHEKNVWKSWHAKITYFLSVVILALSSLSLSSINSSSSFKRCASLSFWAGDFCPSLYIAWRSLHCLTHGLIGHKVHGLCKWIG